VATCRPAKCPHHELSQVRPGNVISHFAEITKFSHSHTRKSVRGLVTLLPNIIAQCLFPRTRTDGSSEGMRMEEHSTHRQEESDELRGLCRSYVQTSATTTDCCGAGQAAIDKLPDEVLLDIFSFYLDNDNSAYEPRDTDEWHTLVHVCRRWREVVFASPRRLNLALLCGEKTPVRKMLNIWPAFPMDIQSQLEWFVGSGAGQHHCRTRASRSCAFHHHPQFSKFSRKQARRSNAGAVPRADMSADFGGMLEFFMTSPIRSWVDLPHACERSDYGACDIGQRQY
jgi:hypothetical protein